MNESTMNTYDSANAVYSEVDTADVTKDLPSVIIVEGSKCK